jgi:hypothetical protein
MRAIVPTTRPPVEDRNRPGEREFSSPHTELAFLRPQGAGATFLWLPNPAGGRWRAIDAPAGCRLPTRLPRLAVAPDLPASKLGRPSRLLGNVGQNVALASLVDCGGINQHEATRLLYGSAYGDRDWERDYKRVRDAVKAGREYLSLSWVLPWAAFRRLDEPVPDEWWATERFAEAVNLWLEDAVVHPMAPEPRTESERLRSQADELCDQARRLAPFGDVLALSKYVERVDDRGRVIDDLHRSPWRYDASVVTERVASRDRVAQRLADRLVERSVRQCSGGVDEQVV